MRPEQRWLIFFGTIPYTGEDNYDFSKKIVDPRRQFGLGESYQSPSPQPQPQNAEPGGAGAATGAEPKPNSKK